MSRPLAEVPEPRQIQRAPFLVLYPHQGDDKIRGAARRLGRALFGVRSGAACLWSGLVLFCIGIWCLVPANALFVTLPAWKSLHDIGVLEWQLGLAGAVLGVTRLLGLAFNIYRLRWLVAFLGTVFMIVLAATAWLSGAPSLVTVLAATWALHSLWSLMAIQPMESAE